MAKNAKLNRIARRIGSAVGTADATAHKVAKASVVAKKELEDIAAQLESLKRQLQRTSKRIKKAMA
jgi:ribonuclease HII